MASRMIHAAAVSLVAIAAACPGSDRRSAPLTAGAAAAEMSNASLALASACYGISFDVGRDGAASVQAAVDSGRLIYDASAAAECIAAISAQPCGDALRGVQPSDRCEAVFIGDVVEGGICLDSGECTTGYCSYSTGTCPGICTPGVSEGGVCSWGDQCASGLACTEGFCRAPVTPAIGAECTWALTRVCADGAYCGYDATSTTQYRCAAVSALGGACRADGECEVPLWCDIHGSRTCKPWAGTGQSCASAVCNRWIASCDAGTLTCEPLPKLGQRCAAAGKCDGATFCDTTLATPVCAALPGVGGDCAVSFLQGKTCAAGAWCAYDDINQTRTCVELKDVGGPCIYAGECVAGDYCTARYVAPASGTCAAKQTSGACEDAEQCAAGFYCTAAYQTTGTCEPVKRAGESCAAWDACATDLRCVGGICSVWSCY